MIESLVSVVGQRGVDAAAFLLAFALTALTDSLFHNKLPHDHGREFAVNGGLSKGKARGSGLIFVLCIALVSLAFLPFRVEYVIYTVLLISLAELYGQRAGMVNIGLEGLASIGALVGFLVCYVTGSNWLGLLCGALAGVIVNMIYAFSTVTLCADHTVYGMAVNIFAPALASFIYRVYFGTGSDLKQITTMSSVAIPGLKDIPVLGPLLFDQSPMVYLTFLLVLFTAIFFGKTRAGLSYKAVGEHPQAAATLGIPVVGVKYLACVICGALSGIGGAYLTTCYSSTYTDGIVAGRGFIALAAVIFGRWNAGGILLACLFFGFCDALQIRLQVSGIAIPYQFFQMIPYVATVVVLTLIGARQAGPKANGKPYRREQR